MGMESENRSGADNQQERPIASINPWFISGFVDGEGSFHVAFSRRKDLSKGWILIPEFHVSQNRERASVLSEIQSYFDCGYIKENHKERINDVSQVFVVRKRDDLVNKIVPFFEQYPLRSQKKKDFLVFAQIVKAMNTGHHHSLDGFRSLVSQAYEMNGFGKYRKIPLKDVISL